MPVRTVRVPSYRETEDDLAVLRAAAEGVADAALIRQLISEKAEQLRKAGIAPSTDTQEPLLT